MSSITAQQTKLDLELVPKENRLDIRKCNGRIPRGLTPREPTFQVVLDAIALTPCYPVFLITVDVPEIFLRVSGRDFDPLPSEEDTVYFLRELGHTGEINSLNDVVVDQMHQPWRTFAALINQGLPGKTSGLDKLRLSRAQILWGIPAMKESKAYKTYLGYATCVVPPKIARKFKKAYPSKKDIDLVPIDEEPVTKGKRVKRSVKKSSTKPATGVVIREAHVEIKSKSKEKEKVDVTCGKGIEFLSEVALTEEAQMKEVRKKSLRNFYKTHPSGSGTVAQKPQCVDKITPTVISEGTGDKPGVSDVTEDDSTESESESWGNNEDDNNNDQDSNGDQEEEEFVHTPSPTNDKDDDNLESESDDVNKSDKESDDLIKGDKEIVLGEGADAEMIDAQQGNENLETTQEQVVEDAHVTISTVTKKTEVPVTSSSRSSDLASKFLNFLDIPHTDAETVSPLDVYVHHKVPRTQAPTLLIIPVSVITESSPILPKEVSNFAPPVIEALIKESRDEVTLVKVSYQPHSTYEAASTLTEFKLKKILIDKIEKSKAYLAAPEHRDCYNSLKKSYDLDKYFFFSYDVYSLKRSPKDKDKDEDPSAGSDIGLKKRKLSKDAEPTTGPKKKDSTSGSSKGTKSQPKSSGKSVQSEEPMFEVADSDMPQDQEGNLGDNEDETRNKTASRRDWFKKPTPPQEPTDQSRTLTGILARLYRNDQLKIG
ncbi:hypothetical protein Tco_1289153 [Tanacetum coccineum]